MKHFRKIWDAEKNQWIMTTKGMTPGEAYAKFLKLFPDCTDVTRAAFSNQRSRIGAAGKCTNPGKSRKAKPLYSEHLKKGIVYIKVEQPNKWISKAKYVYQQAHPEEDTSEPSNYIFLDGDRNNFNPGNIERVSYDIIGIFSSIGGPVKGNALETRIRLAQAKIKKAQLDLGEKLNMVYKVGHYRKFKR